MRRDFIRPSFRVVHKKRYCLFPSSVVFFIIQYLADRKGVSRDLATTKRLKKRDLKEDQFVTKTFQVAGYMQHNRTQVILGVAGVVVLIVVVLLFARFRASSSMSTNAILSQGVGMYQSGDYQNAAFRLSTFLQSHSGHSDAGYAALLCGDSNFYLNRWDEADRYYRIAVEKTSPDSDFHYSARFGLAAVEEGRGKPIEAAGLYEKLATTQEDAGRKAHILFAALRCSFTGGDAARATGLLDRFSADDLDPIDLAGYEMLKVELEMTR